jgi:hypothetical protein
MNFKFCVKKSKKIPGPTQSIKKCVVLANRWREFRDSTDEK